MTATTARRPRIPEALAIKIDELRSMTDSSFEEYVRDVLESHVARYEREVDPEYVEGATRLHEFYDNGGAYCWIDTLDGGWGETKDPDVIAGLALEDEGYDAVGVHITRTTARALRDAMTELLEQTAPVAAPVRAIK